MATHEGTSFWATLPGIVTAIAGLVTAGTGLLIALSQVGVLGDDDSPSAEAGAVGAPGPSQSGPTPTGDAAGDVDGSALAGSWRGVASTPGGTDTFRVELDIGQVCRLNEECGTISVSSAPCTGRVTLQSVRSRTFEFFVHDFTPGSSPDCSEGAGDFFELVDEETLKYTTDYSGAVGLLDRQS